MFLSLPELQKERGFPHPSRKKKLLKLKRESTRFTSNRRDNVFGRSKSFAEQLRLALCSKWR